MRGQKATQLEGIVSEDVNYLRFDYRGMGESIHCSNASSSSTSSKFEDMTLSIWIQDCIKLIKHTVDRESPLFFVGSSMGGWICTVVAMHFKQRVVGMVTLAAAPDFTLDIEKSMTAEQRKEIDEKGYFIRHSEYSPDEAYIIGGALLKDANAGEGHLLLRRDEHEATIQAQTKQAIHRRQKE